MVDKQLFRLISDRKKYLWINLVNQVICLLLNVAITFFLIYSIKAIVENKTLAMVICLSITFACAILRFILFFVANHLSNKLGDFASRKVRTDLYRKYLYLKNINNIKPNEMSQLSTEGVEQLKLYYAVYLPNLFFSVIAPLILFILMSVIDWKVALIYLVCVPIIPGSIIAVSKWAKKIFNKYWDLYLNLGNKFLDNTNGLKELKIFKADKKAQHEMNKQSEQFRKITMKVLVMQLASVTIMDLVAFGGAAIGIVISLVIMKNGLDIYLVSFLVLIGAEFFLPMRALGSAFHMAMNGATAGKKIMSILNGDELNDGKLKIKNIDNIEINDLSLKFDEKIILKNINMKLTKNNFYSIIGQSGSGKTQLTKTIAKLNYDYSGNIKINGIDLKEINNQSYYEKICYISNNSYLFNDTIKHNFQFINPNITDKQIYKLLELVKLKEFIKENGGLDFVVNSDCSNISGGQKQRIILAMNLAKKYDLYIFDEITSNVDLDSEKIILKLIKQQIKNSIVILITHRVNSIKITDHTYLLKNKKIFEQGNYKQLLNQNSQTNKMYSLQKSLEKIYETKFNA